jgi:phosphoribosylaminoimidazolecarboxamide formyltransferase/IMP cyclohydrolase
MSKKLALISVSDKSGIVEFARRLSGFNFSILSTGGTAKTLVEAGLEITQVSEHTQFPEMMAGRVKTLHPRIHAGLLGRNNLDDDVMQQHDIPRIHLAVVNLYPFEEVTSKAGCTLEDAIENIDIGGPAMVRSAAKNYAAVAIVTEPTQYPDVLSQLEKGKGELDPGFRFELAVAAFNRIAQYDAAISNYLSAVNPKGEAEFFPRQVNQNYGKIMALRYGENPHQKAAWYKDSKSLAGGLASAKQLQGKELSFNNIADADSAWTCVQQFSAPACVIVKHANPCGAAVAADLISAYEKAWSTDSTSAFGGIIAFNDTVDEKIVESIIGRQFVEVLLAPAYSSEALEALKQKKNVRVLKVPAGSAQSQMDLKRVNGGLLIQMEDKASVCREDCRVVSKRQPSERQWDDLLFSWKIAKMVKSNAIVYAASGQTMGIGAGQMSRVDSARIARWKADDAGLDLSGSAMASDAFFPFRDGIDTAAEAGVSCVIQPGGSMRDDETIAAADEHDMVMVFTGVRHFRH